MDNGWIKIHRKITEWEWFSEPATRDVFIYLLLKANHKDGRWKGVEVKRGERVTGRKELAKILGFTEQQIRTAITKLKSTNEITIKTTNRFSIVKVNKYEEYQLDNQQSTNNQPTDNQQITTNKNVKNDKNIYGEKFETLTYNQKGDVFEMIKQYKQNTGESPKQGNIDIMVEKALK